MTVEVTLASIVVVKVDVDSSRSVNGEDSDIDVAAVSDVGISSDVGKDPGVLLVSIVPSAASLVRLMPSNNVIVVVVMLASVNELSSGTGDVTAVLSASPGGDVLLSGLAVAELAATGAVKDAEEVARTGTRVVVVVYVDIAHVFFFSGEGSVGGLDSAGADPSARSCDVKVVGLACAAVDDAAPLLLTGASDGSVAVVKTTSTLLQTTPGSKPSKTNPSKLSGTILCWIARHALATSI